MSGWTHNEGCSSAKQKTPLVVWIAKWYLGVLRDAVEEDLECAPPLRDEIAGEAAWTWQQNTHTAHRVQQRQGAGERERGCAARTEHSLLRDRRHEHAIVLGRQLVVQPLQNNASRQQGSSATDVQSDFGAKLPDAP